MPDEEIERDQLPHPHRKQRRQNAAGNGEQDEHHEIAALQRPAFRSGEIDRPCGGDQRHAEQDRKRLVPHQHRMLIECRQPLRQQHRGKRQGKNRQRDGKEIARGDPCVKRRGFWLVIEPVGPAQSAHGHAEALDRHRYADDLQRLQVHDRPFAKRIEHRHEDHAPAGPRRVRDDRPDHTDAGQEPQPAQQVGIVGNEQQQEQPDGEQYAPADQHQPPPGERGQSRLGRSHRSAVAISTPRRCA